MPKIINAFAGDNPLTEALTGFASSFGSNTPQTEVFRQKAKGLQRENANIPLLADAIANGDYTAAARAGILADRDVKNVAGYGQYVGVNRYGPSSNEALTATMAVPGANYGNTVQGTNAEMANKRGIAQMTTDRQIAHDQSKYENTPTSVLVNGIPTMVSQAEALRTRAQPVLSLPQAQGGILQTDAPTLTAEQRATAGGYAPKMPSALYAGVTASGTPTTTADGRTSIQTGEPIVGPVKKLEGPTTEGLSGNHSVDQKLLEARNTRDRTVLMIDRLDQNLAQPNADQAVGYLGALARGFNDIRAQSEASVRLFGGELKDQAFSSPENRAAVDSVMHSVFGNPAVSQKAQALGINSAIIRSQVQDLAYMYAKTQDPSGRVGVDDIRRASETVGTMIQDPAAGRAVLKDLKDRVVSSHDIVERNTRAMFPTVRPVAPSTGTSTGGAMPSAGQPPARIRIDANGNLIQ
jgi:hypothetical protein